MKKVLLIDANSLIHRCFHALPELRDQSGQPTGALYAIGGILLKIINQRKYDYAAALFDRPEPTFRKEKFADYKIHRPKAPDDLVSQIIKAHELFSSFSIKTFELPGYEADDLIGTLAKKLSVKEKIAVTILTGDLDSLQLIEDNLIEVETFKKGISETFIYDEAAVRSRYGISPKQLIDYKGLVGDQSDNIPGVSQIGPKTASSIIQKYDSIENFLEKGLSEKSHQKILDSREIALLSKELATIDCNAPLKVELEELLFSPQKEEIENYFKKHGFLSLLKRMDTSSAAQNKKRSARFIDQTDKSQDYFTLSREEGKTIQVGYNLKEIFKKKDLAEPYFDVKIGCDILEINASNWQEASIKLFKEELSYEDFIKKSFPWILKKLKESEMEDLFFDIEMPLVPVIARIEKNGILIDKKILKKTSEEIIIEINKIKEEIEEEIGKDINLNSPKQLLELFNSKLGIRIKSTSAKNLEKIKEGNSFIKQLLEYRELFKMKTTYLDGLTKATREDGKIHPNFIQVGAATGRMSCQNPNLQNIPQESAWSEKIRNAFVAQKDFSLLSFDYSQIELRVLAFLSKDKNMLEAFEKGEDIHAITAQKIFGKKEISPKERRLAKTLNFGMIYGMGYRALSQQAGISTAEAKDFMDKYFSEFPEIKRWQKNVLEQTRKNGYISNLNKRRRNLPQINSFQGFLASEAERMAVNMPSQSLAADILKISMVRVDDFIRENNLVGKINMILTIHDELVFEISDSIIKDGERSQIISQIKRIMESAYDLGRVPLLTEVKMGKRWGELK